MNRSSIIEHIRRKKSYLCVGIDPDEKLLPPDFVGEGSSGVKRFCLAIIDAVAPYCVAFKPNFAFFETLGAEGWQILQVISQHVKLHHPQHFLIADAKRGDIGNTSTRYAEAILNKLNYDAITISPYMGEDSVKPFLIKDKWGIVLMLTSNAGSDNFQKLRIEKSGSPLYVEVGKTATLWGNTENLMFVTGATHPQELKEIRSLFPDYFLLIPGVGAQGGSLEDVSEAALTDFGGILVNSSRGIIHCSNGDDFLERAVDSASVLQAQMEKMLLSKGLV